MARQTPAQKDTIDRVMHAFKEGDLDKRDGKPVKNPKQAIAIALHEAGASNQEDEASNKRNVARTKRRERSGQTAPVPNESEEAGSGETHAALHDEARRKNIPGRSKMTKAELAGAVHRSSG